MLLNAFVSGALAAAVAVGLPFIRSAALRKEASSGLFDRASAAFYDQANSLLQDHERLPLEVVRTICAAGDTLASYKRTMRVAKRLATEQSSMLPEEREHWREALDKLTDAQRELFDAAMSSALEAITFATVRYRTRIYERVFSAARERPEARFSSTEAKLGIFALSRPEPCVKAA